MATNPNSPEKRQMAEPRPAPEGADMGGMRSTADAGLDRAAQRSTEHAEADPVLPAPTAGASPRASATTDEHDDEWRHEPRPPVDESPLESFAKSIGETLTGSVDEPKAPPPKAQR